MTTDEMRARSDKALEQCENGGDAFIDVSDVSHKDMSLFRGIIENSGLTIINEDAKHITVTNG